MSVHPPEPAVAGIRTTLTAGRPVTSPAVIPARYELPTRVVLVEQLPRNAGANLARVELRSLADSR
ncbi:hypothetical protein [Streptomyces sp. NPDC002588]|uniref:hypothetical protein n=1 Tax=Streptomyces sp. NPDC002588 TaxID=3154419 RepID=UPI0033320085